MTTALDQVGRRAVATPAQIGQQTAVEQARAVAEVAAAIQVARQFPRDMAQVEADVHEVCSDIDLAREAFYAVENRGSGPSVQLARELARIFGNFQFGVHELRRDDVAGESEVQAFAWDVERNTRATRTFVNPHAKMVGKGSDKRRVGLIDLTDIYLSNQNVGARAVRECILTTLPKRLVRLAERLCRETIEKGDGRPTSDRAQEAIKAFAAMPIPVTEQQLVARLHGRKPGEWTPQDIADLEVVYNSIRRGETTAEEQFEADAPRVTAGEITGQGQKPPAGAKATSTQLAKIHAILKDHNIESDEAVRTAIGEILHRPPASRTTLTKVDADTVIEHLEKLPQPPAPDGGEQS